jgi:hypothetical protein
LLSAEVRVFCMPRMTRGGRLVGGFERIVLGNVRRFDAVHSLLPPAAVESLGDIALARSDHDAARKAYEDTLPLYR